MKPLTAEDLDAKYVVVKGLKIRYIVIGSGAPLVLIHGIGEFLEVWWLNVLPLSEHYRVYAIDLPGHGLSDKPKIDYNLAFATDVVSGFEQAMGIDRASLIGHSLGGLIAMSVAVSYPEQVGKLVLVDSAGFNDRVPLLYRLCCLPLVGELIVEPTVKAGIRHGMKRAFYNPDLVSDEMVEKDYQFMKMPGAKQALLNIIRHGVSFRGPSPEIIFLDKLSLIKSPTLLIHGAQDKVIPLQYARKARRLIPRARLKIIEECGHCPYIEKTPEFNKTVINFLGGS